MAPWGQAARMFLEIPPERLSPEALHSILEEFATRDGTELSDLESKLAQLRAQLEAGALRLMFDSEEGTCQLVRADRFPTGGDPAGS